MPLTYKPNYWIKPSIENDFFHKKVCDRCGANLKSGRSMSWFTEEALCMHCMEKESKLKQKMKRRGYNPDRHEGCGPIRYEVLKWQFGGD